MNLIDSQIKTPFTLRYILKRDIKTICDIEDDIFEFPWKFDQFQKCTKTANTVCYTIEAKEQIAGYIIYSIDDKTLTIKKMCVAREFQGQGIEDTVIDTIKAKLKKMGFTHITYSVHSNILQTQLLLKRNGFRCVKTWNSEDGEEYVFLFGDTHKEE